MLYIINLRRGMQTWEYAPQYALRTYAYLLPLAGVAKLIQFLLAYLPPTLVQQLATLLVLQSTAGDNNSLLMTAAVDNKPLLFAVLRSFLALVSCYSELSFLDAIHNKISPMIAYWTALCSLSAAGNFHASQAFLPSSTVMILWRLSVANQLNGYHAIAIFWGLVAVLAVGWPFCAVLFISTGFWAVWKAGLEQLVTEKIWKMSQVRPIMQVLLRTLLHAIVIQTIVMGIDYYFYGKLVSPIWNIFAYNAQSGGDELYGVEPLSYYVKNLLLNFNLAAILGIISLPMICFKKLVNRFTTQTMNDDSSSYKTSSLEVLVLVPMYTWMAIVLPRAHKEERFLFPIYPALCFGAALTMREILHMATKVINSILKRQENDKQRKRNINLLLGLALLHLSAIISISRSFALHHNYAAPLDIYRDFFTLASPAPGILGESASAYVCTAGEWYRFPSSFFLPENYQLGFLKSSFTGQLPQPFTRNGSKENSMIVQAGKFNDMNKEEMDRYIDISKCSYVIELVPPLSELDSTIDKPECLQYMESDSSESSWIKVASRNYLDAESTPFLHRILYIPFGRDDKVVFKGYNLYARK